jgi:nucleotide-binding universal stress UspA family protein
MVANVGSFEAFGESVALGGGVFDRIFVPIDFSIASHLALGAALELHRTHGSTLCLFHAAESDGSDEWLAGIGSPAAGGDWVKKGEARLRRFLENVAPSVAGSDRIEVMAAVGEPLRWIRAAAHEWKATLIIAPASAHADLFRSSAEKLVRDTDIPTLVLPVLH